MTTGLDQVCSISLKHSSLNLFWSALHIRFLANLFCYCTERIYNKILKLQVSIFVEKKLFTMLEFNWQKNESIARAAIFMTHFWLPALARLSYAIQPVLINIH